MPEAWRAAAAVEMRRIETAALRLANQPMNGARTKLGMLRKLGGGHPQGARRQDTLDRRHSSPSARRAVVDQVRREMAAACVAKADEWNEPPLDEQD